MPSDAVVIALSTGLLTLIGIIANGIVVYFVAKLNIKAEEAVKAAADLKYKFEETNKIASKKLDDIGNVGKSVHVLVNSNMGVQLKISAIALRRLADMNKSSKKDQMAAKLAETALRDHEESQAQLDSMKGAKHAST